MRRWSAVLALGSLLAAGCGSGDDDAAAPATTTTEAPATTVTTSVPSTTVAPTTSTRRGATTTSTTAPTPAKAVIEPHVVSGLPLGSNKSQAIALFGQPTTSGQDTDLSGKTYDFLGWQFSANRGLTLNYRTEGVTSPLLTDWKATAPGPATKGGVQVGDSAAKVTAAHGPLQPFCCESRVASVTQDQGRMIVVVANDTQKVVQIIGGDPEFWSRSIAD